MNIDFKRAHTETQIEQRQIEILKAMETLYLKKSFQDIRMIDISSLTSVTRTSLYSYYKNKEEVLLGVLKHHFVLMTEEMRDLISLNDRDEFISSLAEILMKHFIILKIFSKNLADMEDHVSLDKLVEFKKDFKVFKEVYFELVEKQKNITIEEEKTLSYGLFICFLYGVYPLTHPTKMQLEAMKQASFQIDLDFKDFIIGALKTIF